MATLEPVTLAFPTTLVEVREIWVEVRTRDDEALVTSVELLSPANKAEPGLGESILKRRGLIRRRVNLVEIDLLIGGRRLAMEGELPPGDYYAFVARGERMPECSVYAWSVRDPLPTIPVPLLPPDADVPLDLAPLFATAYQRGRYGRTLKYGVPLGLPLSADSLLWAESGSQEGCALS